MRSSCVVFAGGGSDTKKTLYTICVLGASGDADTSVFADVSGCSADDVSAVERMDISVTGGIWFGGCIDGDITWVYY